MVSLPYERPHHQRIVQALNALDPTTLEQCECYFGGGTAIALLLGEYRESVDIDFVCSSIEGFRRLRNLVTDNSLGALVSPGAELPLARDVRRDQYGIRAVLLVDEIPIRLELIQEGRVKVGGQIVPQLPVPVLDRSDLYTEKLLANADRWADASALYRDIIDLSAMTAAWGPIPTQAWSKARTAYGESVDKAYHDARVFMHDNPQRLAESFQRMEISHDWQMRVRSVLGVSVQDGFSL